MKSVKILAVILSVCFLASFGAGAPQQQDDVVAVFADSGPFDAPENIFDRLSDLFFPRREGEPVDEEVYLGGFPLGMTLDGSGVTVIGLNEFIDEEGKVVCPALDAGLQIYDVIIELDGNKIYNSTKLSEIASESGGESLSVKFMRGDEIYEQRITPKMDLSKGQYRLGLWTRDAASGIGTLTYTRKDLRFGSLGHPISSADGKSVKVTGGNVYLCDINGIVKGTRGTAGELKGNFGYDKKIGTIYANNKYGVYGSFYEMPDFDTQRIPVASAAEVKPGKAYIYTTLDDNVRRAYEVEIVKAAYQRTPDDKGMVLSVTDPVLLKKTGGIVQGMSGSPIVQDGKLIGAVTHVFVNDPTKGYGVYAQWMLLN